MIIGFIIFWFYREVFEKTPRASRKAKIIYPKSTRIKS